MILIQAVLIYILRRLFPLLIIVLIVGTTDTRQITFSYDPDTEHFASDQFRGDLQADKDSKSDFRLRENEIVLGGGTTMLSGYQQLSISENRTYVGALYVRGDSVAVEVFHIDGSPVHRIGNLAEYDQNDPSVMLYLLDNGSFIYRDNIAGFSYYDEQGEQVFRASNGYGSPDGELISEVSATSGGQTMILYNPKIFYGDKTFSRIQQASFNDGETQSISTFGNETINDIRLHSSGELMLVFLTDESTGNHTGKVMTNDGEVLMNVDYDNLPIKEMILSPDARFVTARASGRVMVHRVDTGERVGSASFNEPVLTANYMPDGVLAVLTGRVNSNELRDLRGHMIDLQQKRVVRESSGISTLYNEKFPLMLHFERDGTYRLSGVNREILIRHTL